MPNQNDSLAALRELGFSKKEILALDPKLFSEDEKRAFINLLYGDSNEWSWKQELQSVSANLHRWNALLNEASSGQRYRLGHQRLIDVAKRSSATRVESTVTSFADWVFRLYIPQSNYASMLRGRQLEREIARRRVPVPQHSRWKLEYNGMSDSKEKAKQISELTVNGISICGKPDLVFREKDTKRVLIIEVKVSEADIHSDGWPNMRAQLWAYSKIDEWKDAPEVILVGETWGFKNGLRLRNVNRWLRGDVKFERENAELFSCYQEACSEGEKPD